MTKDKRNEINNLQGDIWSSDDDFLLAETILRNVREGNTVMEGCREIERITEGRRTAAASKFRWFTKLVEQYRAGYELAKQKGDVIRKAKKRKTNQGERYKEIVEEVIDGESNVEEKEIEAEDFLVLAKKFKEQQSSKEKKFRELENELKAEKRRTLDLERRLRDSRIELENVYQNLEFKKKDYDNLMEALSVLKGVGISIKIPEPTRTKYSVSKSGTVELVESS